MNKKCDQASICLAGAVEGEVKRSKKATHFDLSSAVPGGTLSVHVRVPSDIQVKENACAFIFDAKMYKSIDNKGSDFALNVGKDGIVIVDEYHGTPKASISLIGDVVSSMKHSEGFVEFAVMIKTATEPIRLHIIAEVKDKSKWILQKGDKVGLFGGVIEKRSEDKNSSFAITVSDCNVHLIPYYDGKQHADTL